MSLILNGIFKDDMVFQRDREIRVFGLASNESGNKVVATIKDKRKNVAKAETTEIYEDGFFLVTLPPLPKGGPYTLKVESKKDPEKIKISRVFIGEVWLAGGQSNMEYPLVRSEFAKAEIERMPENNIHFYTVPVAGTYDEKQKEAEETSKWICVDRETCKNMSAVAYYFAMRVNEHLAGKEDDDIHIGIIGCYLGGTSLASWQSLESLEKTNEGIKYINEYLDEIENKSEEEYEKELSAYEAELDRYYSRAQVLFDENPYATYKDIENRFGGAPWPPPVGKTSLRRPGALFDTMVLRVAPYNLRGVIFYQGEADVEEHYDDYGAVFKTLIEEWRESFLNRDLPFLFCQLPMYTSKDRKYMGYDDLKWPKLRRQQAKVANDVKDAYMTVLADCGEFDNVHPSDKKTPGHRLADLALRFVYDFKDIPAVSPYVVDIRRGEGVEITFGGDYNNLNLPTSLSSDDSGFEVAGEDGRYYPAEASVDFDGRTVLLKCSKVEFPVKVRYAFFSYGMANLVSDTGLAASPFEVNIDNTIGDFY
ncbi:MAG: hypothetical protein J5685_12490 [Clostridiales bacterium]|nr:hypothetical protein [Clostridiales bacterium]